jgi:hypothetical protein
LLKRLYPDAIESIFERENVFHPLQGSHSLLVDFGRTTGGL